MASYLKLKSRPQGPRDLMRFLCILYDHSEGKVTAWYKQPGEFMVQLTPEYQDTPAWNIGGFWENRTLSSLYNGVVSLGKYDLVSLKGPPSGSTFWLGLKTPDQS